MRKTIDIMDRRNWCHDLPRNKWCNHAGLGGFMGHTCQPNDPFLASLIRFIKSLDSHEES
jgi:hypothetical protein